MAIAFDAVAGVAGAASFSSAATGTLTNGMAVLVVYNNGSTLTATWGGVAMTSVYNSGNIQIFMLANPASGVQTVATSANMWGYGITYSGVSPNLITDAGAGSDYPTGSTGNITQANTTVADNCWNIMFVASNVFYSASTGTTIRLNDKSSGGIAVSVGDSNSAKTPAGSYSMAMTRDGGGTGNAGWRVFSIQPYLTPPAAPLYALEMYNFPVAFQQNICALTTTLLTSTINAVTNVRKSATEWINQDKS